MEIKIVTIVVNGEQNRESTVVFRKRKCKTNGLFRSIGANSSRKQKFYSPLCLCSQAQWDTSYQDNSQNLDY